MKTIQDKVARTGLEGSVNLTDSTVSELTKEMEAEISNIAAGFVVWMSKQAANAQGEATPGSEGSNGKRFKQSGPVEEVQINPTMISVDSP